MKNFKRNWLWIFIGFIVVVLAYLVAINLTTNPVAMLGIVAVGGFIGSYLAARKSNCSEETPSTKFIR